MIFLRERRFHGLSRAPRIECNNMICTSENKLDWLQLPPRDRMSSVDMTSIYGANKVSAAYCGLRRIPESQRGYWSHGWIPQHHFVDPRAVGHMGVTHRDHFKSIWTGTQKEAKYLLGHGFEAHAIGVPIVYVPDRLYERRDRTLLVMPAHSLHYTQHTWRFQEYAESIRAIRDEFESVVVCLHAACIANGYWVNEFRSLGFPVIVGADPLDRNSLDRTRALMSQFEFVTTNGFGSHMAYGAAFGAKVSIYGEFCAPRSEDYDEDPWFQENPDLLEKLLPLLSEGSVRKEFPSFFCHPAAATGRREWGMHQIGIDCRLSPRELTTLFGWNWASRVLGDGRRRLFFLGCRLVPDPIKKPVRAMLDPSWANFRREMNRLEKYPPGEVGIARLRGEQFEFRDAPQFIRSWKQVFEDRVFDFPCFSRNPLIIDCGAGIGLAIRYWSRKHPRARIVAFEPDPDLFAILKRNCEGLTTGDLQLFNSVVTIGNGAVDARNAAPASSRYWHTDELTNNSAPKPSVDLLQLLDNPIDFLRLDVSGINFEVLESYSTELANVRRMCIEYQSSLSSKQQLDELLKVLTAAGFRYYVAPSGKASANPFMEIQAAGGCDMRLTIWAYRGRKFPRTMVTDF